MLSILMMLCIAYVLHLHAQRALSLPEPIEWTWEVRPDHPDTALPNVLLLGDSITRDYFPEVKKRLTGIANVYLMASSTCVDDPRLPRQIAEFGRMERVHFAVIHFNNGMHGWEYSETDYKKGFPAFLHAVHDLTASNGKLIWATTTPVLENAAGGASNPRIDARNAIAGAIVAARGIAIDDQHRLMEKHRDLHRDPVHFGEAGATLQGDQAADRILEALRPER